MAKRKPTLPDYGTVQIKGITYFRTRVSDDEGNRFSLYAATREELYEKVLEVEKQIENKLTTEAKKLGGIALKFVSPSFDGMPDRLVLIPDGHIAFVELKAPGKKPRPLQLSRHRLLRSLGFRVYVIDSVEQIGGMLDEIRTS